MTTLNELKYNLENFKRVEKAMLRYHRNERIPFWLYENLTNSIDIYNDYIKELERENKTK